MILALLLLVALVIVFTVGKTQGDKIAARFPIMKSRWRQSAPLRFRSYG